MTHDPYCNAKNGSTPWTPEEDAEIVTLRAEGLEFKEIHMKLPKRTIAAIRNRIMVLRVGHDIIRKRQRERRKSQRKEYTINHVVEPRIVVPAEVLEDRERRHAAPRSLTALILGDPEPGRARL